MVYYCLTIGRLLFAPQRLEKNESRLSIRPIINYWLEHNKSFVGHPRLLAIHQVVYHFLSNLLSTSDQLSIIVEPLVYFFL